MIAWSQKDGSPLAWGGMLRPLGSLLCAFILAQVLALPLYAQGLSNGTLIAGYSVTINDNTDFRYGSLEYRYQLKWQRLSILGALEWNGDNRYSTVGLFMTLFRGRRFRLGIGSGPGFMNNGKSVLGSELEFRTFAEFQVRLGSRFAWGVDVCHYSNGGISSVNPGAESVRFFIAWRLGRASPNICAGDSNRSLSWRSPSTSVMTLRH